MDIPGISGGNDTNYKLPKRYEDTKPAQSIGEDIRKKVEAIFSKQTEDALQRNEKAVWKAAEHYKNECVEKALQQAKVDKEKEIKKLQKQHVKDTKIELSKLEGIMQQKCIKQVYEERRAGQEAMKAALNDLQIQCNENTEAAISETITKQQFIAKSEAEKREREYSEEMESLKDLLEQKHQLDLQKLTNELEQVKEQAVKEARVEERLLAADNLTQVEENYDMQIAALKERIQESIQKHSNTLSDLQNMTNDRDFYVEKLKELRSQFTKFIEECRPDFDIGQSDFLLPPFPKDVMKT